MADLTRSRCYCQIVQVQNERTTKVLQVWRHGYENENLLVMDVFPVLYIWAEAIACGLQVSREYGGRGEVLLSRKVCSNVRLGPDKHASYVV